MKINQKILKFFSDKDIGIAEVARNYGTSRQNLTQILLCCIPKILKNESNSQPQTLAEHIVECCVVSQRYSKMKAIHNRTPTASRLAKVVLYPKDTQK